MNEFEIPPAPKKEPQDKLPWGALAVLGVIIVVMCGLLVVTVMPLLRDRPDGQADAGSANCQELVDQALLVSDETCQQIGPNQACYGNRAVEAELAPGHIERFALVGDVIPVESINRLSASPLDANTNEWGVAVIRLQGVLEGTVPGQAVTFLVFGDTAIDNASGDMQTFYFSSGFGRITCQQAAYDGILVTMPDGTSVVFRANEVDFVVSGSALLSAEPFENLTLDVLEGEALVTAGGEQQHVEAGESVDIPMGGEDGTSAEGSPSDPYPSDDSIPDLKCILNPDICKLQPTNTSPPPAQDTALPTNTSVPAPPGQPTYTPVPLATSTSAPQASNTSPPGATSTPAPNTPTRTNTPNPTATNTPVSGSCTDIILAAGGGDSDFTITNNYSSDIILTNVSVTWPGSNGNLIRIRLLPATIWAGNLPPDSANITLTSQGSSRTVALGQTNTLRFEFENDAAGTGYSITVTFNVGCARSASK